MPKARKPRRQVESPLGETKGKPWARTEGESPQAYRAFTHYLLLGSRRSISAVGRDLYPGSGQRKDDATGRLRSWAVQFSWVARSSAYDTEKFEATREAEEAAEVLDVLEARSRQRVTRDRVWDVFGKALDKLNSLLDRPLKEDASLVSKDLHLAAGALERASVAVGKVLWGLESQIAPQEQQANTLPPEGAAKFEVWLSQQPSEEGEPEAVVGKIR